MQKRPFGKTGLSVSPLGFGAAPIGYLQTDIDAVGRIVNLLLDSGVNFIDTAANYPGSEPALAQSVGHRRKEFILVSKCGFSLPDLQGEPWSADLITRTVDRSLKNLKTDHLDVMLLHSCDLATLQKGEAISALLNARDAGKIRFAGYSGDNEAAEWAARFDDFAAIETSINIADQHNIDRVLPLCKANNKGVIAKRPIANAAWKRPSDQRGIYQSYAAEYTKRIAEMSLKPQEFGFASSDDCAWTELALRFTLSFPEVSTAIVGTTNPDNARVNLACAEKGPLSADQLQKLRDRFRACDKTGAWTSQT